MLKTLQSLRSVRRRANGKAQWWAAAAARVSGIVAHAAAAPPASDTRYRLFIS